MTLLIARFLIGGVLAAASPAGQTSAIDVDEVLALAQKGDSKAQCRLGTYYSEGPDEARDLGKAQREERVDV